MTLPGLALFYGGLVRRKNVLSVFAQCFGIAGLVTILWWPAATAWSSPTATTHQGLHWAAWNSRLLQRRHLRPQHRTMPTGFPITSLHVPVDVRHHHPGPDPRRHRRTHEILAPSSLHHVLDVRRLFPAGPHGLGHRRHDERRLERPRKIKAIDFAGGTVVHMSSGWSALNPLHDSRQAHRLRQGNNRAAQHGALFHRHRHALGGLVRLQRRQRLAADVIAANAFITTTLATAIASFVWPRWNG